METGCVGGGGDFLEPDGKQKSLRDSTYSTSIHWAPSPCWGWSLAILPPGSSPPQPVDKQSRWRGTLSSHQGRGRCIRLQHRGVFNPLIRGLGGREGLLGDAEINLRPAGPTALRQRLEEAMGKESPVSGAGRADGSPQTPWTCPSSAIAPWCGVCPCHPVAYWVATGCLAAVTACIKRNKNTDYPSWLISTIFLDPLYAL